MGAEVSVMGPGFYIIAIMGCADGSAACTPVATMPTITSTITSSMSENAGGCDVVRVMRVQTTRGRSQDVGEQRL